MSKKTKGEIKNKKDDEIKRLKKHIKELEKSEIKCKQEEAQIQHLNLVLRTIRNVNQLVIREKNRYLLIQKACEILTENSEYDNAWIVLLDEKGKYLASAEAGLGKDFTPIKKLLEQGKWTKCGKRALKQKKLIITEDPEKECTDCPLSQSYAERGGYSVCLRHGDTIYGLLTVSVLSIFLKNEVEQELFREVSGDIGFALYSIEIEQERKQAEEALKESEELYRAVVEHSHDGLLIVGKDYKFIYVNDRLCEMLSHTREEIIGHDFREFLDEESRKVVAERYIKRQRLEIVPSRYEFNIVRKDSEKRHVEISSTVVKDSKGEMQTIAQILDITEQKNVEKIQKTMFNISNALNKTENLYELFLKIREHLGKVIDTTNFYVALYDEKTNMISLPFLVDKKDDFKTFPAGKTLTAYVIKTGKPLLATNDVVKELTEKGIIETIGTPSEIWMGVPLKIGKKVIGVIVVQNYDDPHGYTEKDIDILTFVSEEIALAIKHKQADEILKRSEERFKKLSNLTFEGILIHDKGMVVDVNQSLLKMIGYTQNELIGKNIIELCVPLEYQKTIKANISKKSINPYEEMARNKDGNLIPIEIESKNIKFKGEELRVTAIRDITAHKKAEEELEKHRDHLEELVKERTTELEETNKELKRFNKLFVGREFRIKELKDKIKEMARRK